MNYKSLFLLNEEICYLNYGSFGACPREIFKVYQEFQLELEKEPVHFITESGMKYLAKSRNALANFIHCHSDDVVLVTNPSYAINTIAKSFPLQTGDEILSTNLEYGALDRVWNYYCKKNNAHYIRQEIPLPILSKEYFIEHFWKGYTPKTKAIFISHITSATGLILPIAEICAEAKKRGLITIVDGAHVPGHIDLNLQNLQADIYTGACHKWMLAPKGASFLYVKKELQNIFDPLLISWGFESTNPSHSIFLDYHQTAGTRDFSAMLCIPACIDFMEKYNWKNVAAKNRALVIKNAASFCELMQKDAISPINKDFLGQLFSIPIKTNATEKLHDHLYNKYKIEIPVTTQGNQNYIRYSIQAFNTQEDLNYLYQTLKEILSEGILLE